MERLRRFACLCLEQCFSFWRFFAPIPAAIAADPARLSGAVNLAADPRQRDAKRAAGGECRGVIRDRIRVCEGTYTAVTGPGSACKRRSRSAAADKGALLRHYACWCRPTPILRCLPAVALGELETRVTAIRRCCWPTKAPLDSASLDHLRLPGARRHPCRPGAPRRGVERSRLTKTRRRPRSVSFSDSGVQSGSAAWPLRPQDHSTSPRMRLPTSSYRPNALP